MFRSYFGHYLGYIKFVPVFILICLNTWSYYAFVFCYLTELDFTGTFNLVSIFLTYHLCFFMFIWCFFKTLKSKVYKPPNQFYVTRSRDQLLKDCSLNDDKNKILKNLSLNLPVVMRSYDGGIRYCNKCTCLKPDRAHHCSVCGMCVLKMDHHCPWVNNCIGFSNYKFFFLFLLYALLYCSFLCLVLTSSMSTFTDQVEDNRGGAITHVFMLWILSSLLIVGLSVLLLLHSFLLLTNRTTLELFQTPLFSCGPVKRAYDRGWRENFLQVFGHKKKYWLVPISSSIGDGVNYPMADILQSIVGKQLLALKERLAEEGMI